MKNKDLKNYAYKTLHDRIVNCVYFPSSVLNESELAKDLGISRTPVREALNRLEIDGYVQVLPKKGILVTPVTLQDVQEIFTTRAIIEPATIKISGPFMNKDDLRDYKKKFLQPEKDIRNSFRLDTDMHLFFIRHSNNKFIIEMMEKVFDVNTRIIISSKQNQYKIHDAVNEHVHILDLLLEERYNEAADYMEYHINQCRNAAFNFFMNMHVYTIQPRSGSPTTTTTQETVSSNPNS